MKSFKFRGLEFHSSRMWQWAQVERALDFMSKMNLNALVFHQSELIDKLVWPDKYFPDPVKWKSWPCRIHVLMGNVLYINKVVRESKERGIDFYPEVKEIFYPDGILELYPELRNADGKVCTTHPFWWEFVEAKMRELLEKVPDIAGVIMSGGSRESMVSISKNECQCERCKNYNPVDWYTNLLNAMYRPLAEKGKTLAIRDFAYSVAQQSYIIKAATAISDDIVVSLKNTPHDYYPTFPDNPQIGHVGNHPQWIEFDTWGQFYGAGFFPASVVEDMQYRMKHCYEQGATGIYLRTDWENLTECSVFNSFNLLNLMAGAKLSSNLDDDIDESYRSWVEYGLFSPLHSSSCIQGPMIPTAPGAYTKLRDFMKASWSVIEKTIFVRGHVYHQDCMWPDIVERGFYMMTGLHSRDDWDPGASKLVVPTDQNMEVIFREKAEAVREVKALPSILQLDSLGLPEPFINEIRDMLDLYELYVRGFEYSVHCCYLVKKATISKDAKDVKKAKETIPTMVAYRKEVVDRLKGTHYPHYVYWLLDEKRLGSLIKDMESLLQNL